MAIKVKKYTPKVEILTFEQAEKLIPQTPTVAGMVQKGMDLKNVLIPRRRAVDALRAAPSDSIRLIGPEKDMPRTITFLRKSNGRFFYAFIKAIEPEPVPAAVNG